MTLTQAALERENAALRQAVDLLHRVSNLVRQSLELEPTCYALLTGVTAGVGLGFNRAMLFFADDRDRSALRGVAAVGPADRDEADRIWKSIESDAPDLDTLYQAGLRQRAERSALDRRVRALSVPIGGDTPIALALRRTALVQGEGTDDLGGLLHLPTAVAAPLRGAESVRGVLYADNCYTERPLDEAAELVLSLIADQAGRAIEHAHHYEELAMRARLDALTGLEHHGRMMEAVDTALGGEPDAPFGLAMIDLDDFKRVNDGYGHLAGDALLCGLGERLRSVLRSGERPYRYGGEEFAVLLPGAHAGDLHAIGERLRRAVADSPFAIDAERRLTATCSVGVAAREPGDSSEALIDRADQALLAAKAAGKNRVVVAGLLDVVREWEGEQGALSEAELRAARRRQRP